MMSLNGQQHIRWGEVEVEVEDFILALLAPNLSLIPIQFQLPVQTESHFLSLRIYRNYSERQACTNSVNPDETPRNAASHQDLHCLPLIQ